jgi:hypothetical protein
MTALNNCLYINSRYRVTGCLLNWASVKLRKWRTPASIPRLAYCGTVSLICEKWRGQNQVCASIN